MKVNSSTLPAALVVMAQEGFRALVAEALYSFEPGFVVSSAADLQQACEWLQRTKPELVVLGPEIGQVAQEQILRKSSTECRFLIYGAGDARLDTSEAKIAWLPPRHDLPGLLAAVHRLFDDPDEVTGVARLNSHQRLGTPSRRASGSKDN